MAKVSLKQLASLLGVSVSTVCKSLKGSYEIGEDTKQRVIEMAQKMGYNPNPYAGSLRHHKSKTIAIIIPEITNNFFIQAISGAESVAHLNDYHLLIYVTNDDVIKEESIIRDLQNGRVDGVIMSLSGATNSYDHINELIQSGVPVVFFDRICHEIETAKITTDDFASGFKATEHLIQNGCKDIAYLSISDNLSIDNQRKQGYLEALNKYDFSINNALILKCDNVEEANYERIKQLLQSESKLDGIFACVERLALTSYYVCGELNIDIPGAIKIISFSNLQTAPLLSPSLTTITQPAYEMGNEAATILFRHLAKKRPSISNENIVIKSSLVERNSTKQV
ncbi:MAG: LacI family DNA-binding transcriptional regulator [Bacteroidota bacterium]